MQYATSRSCSVFKLNSQIFCCVTFFSFVFLWLSQFAQSDPHLYFFNRSHIAVFIWGSCVCVCVLARKISPNSVQKNGEFRFVQPKKVSKLESIIVVESRPGILAKLMPRWWVGASTHRVSHSESAILDLLKTLIRCNTITWRCDTPRHVTCHNVVRGSRTMQMESSVQ